MYGNQQGTGGNVKMTAGKGENGLKGQSHRPHVVFIELHLLALVKVCRNDLDFFKFLWRYSNFKLTRQCHLRVRNRQVLS